jgi:hypothetical protein
LLDDDKNVRATFDTKPTLPLRFGASASEADDSLMSSPGHVPAPAEASSSNLLEATLSPAFSISHSTRRAGSSSFDLALFAPESTATLDNPTAAGQTWNEPYDRMLRLEETTNFTADEMFPLPAGLGTEGEELDNVYHNDRMERAFELNLQEVDGVFQGPCLFGEDSVESDGVWVV